MSEPSYEDDYQDPYERSSGSGGGAPVVSWKFVREGGDKFEAVVVPPDVEIPTRGYKMRGDYQNGSDDDPDDKGFLVWPPRNNPEKIKRPVTEMRHQSLWPDIDIKARDSQGRRIVRPVSRVNVTFETGYKASEFISEDTIKRLKEDETDPNSITLRRMILNSKDLEEKLEKAFKAIGTDRPQPGQTWRIGIEERRSNAPRKGSTTIHSVEVLAPTPETMKIVEAHVARGKAEAAEVAEPYAASSNEPPPF